MNTPKCPKCGNDLVFIEAENFKDEFWGLMKNISTPATWYCDKCEEDVPDESIED